MQSPLIKNTEIKMYILYIMKCVDYPMTYQMIHDTVTEDGLVDYFGFTECFTELFEAGNIASEMDDEEYFTLTEQGRNIVDTLLDILIPGVQRIALAAATRLTSFVKRGAVIRHGYDEDKDGNYNFKFTVTEKDKEVFSLGLSLENKVQVERIESNLSKNCDAIYKAVMALLNGQADYLLK